MIKQQMTKQYSIRLIFGSDKKHDFNLLETEKEKKEFIEEYKQTYFFDSEAELSAFEKGVSASIGYMEVYNIDEF